mmetsp:Transcript_28915/g.54670  ORF Transcript_28915/g.54670 Transcript_28915/m.54670 type:complete len:338 (+) Transcript_28915:1468-2481(+)
MSPNLLLVNDTRRRNEKIDVVRCRCEGITGLGDERVVDFNVEIHLVIEVSAVIFPVDGETTRFSDFSDGASRSTEFSGEIVDGGKRVVSEVVAVRVVVVVIVMTVAMVIILEVVVKASFGTLVVEALGHSACPRLAGEGGWIGLFFCQSFSALASLLLAEFVRLASRLLDESVHLVVVEIHGQDSKSSIGIGAGRVRHENVGERRAFQNLAQCLGLLGRSAHVFEFEEGVLVDGRSCLDDVHVEVEAGSLAFLDFGQHGEFGGLGSLRFFLLDLLADVVILLEDATSVAAIVVGGRGGNALGGGIVERDRERAEREGYKSETNHRDGFTEWVDLFDG